MTNILISNDDGIDSPGIHALEKLAREFGNPVTFAPESEQSGVGHQVTVDQPIQLKKLSDHRYSVKGTPADCVRIAISQFDFKFGLMFSGINSGGNLGVDVLMSGTAAAAREASYFGVSSFAISQYRSRSFEADWNRSARLAKRAIDFVNSKPDPGVGFWNINLPCTQKVSSSAQEVPVRICKVDRNPHQVAYERQGQDLVYDGVYQDRPREPAADVALCFGGAVTASRCW